MKKLTSWTAAAALGLAACQPAEDPAAQYRNALPKTQAVQIGVPDAPSSPSALSVGTAAVDSPAYQSEYAIMSYWMALSVNAGVGWTLEFLKFVTAFPPTKCDDASCTWGPWRDDDALNYWRLHVEKSGDAYVYALSAQPASDAAAPWVDLIAGTAYPGADREHGHGDFVVDFDAQDALQHPGDWRKEDQGTLQVRYDNTAGVVVEADFVNAMNDDPARPHPMNAAYRFDETGAQGDLQIAFEDVTTTEVFSLRTRWVRATGEGRADARYVGLDGQTPVQFDATECWAGAEYLWAEDFDRKAGVVRLGAEANCAPFVTAPDPLLTIELP